ncbi:MAG: peptide deformylase [Gaiellaceae bacterium]
MSDHDHDHDHDDEPEDDDEAERAAESEVRKRIALSQVRQYGDLVLRMRANEVVAFDEELARLVERLTELMHDALGVGLAATQVGVVRRLFVFEHDGKDLVLANPRITQVGKELEVDDEGCLSLGVVRVPVERPTEIVIEGKNAAGEEVKYELDGMSARVAQHELDHLDGVLIVDRTDPVSRKEALARLRPRLLLAPR